MEVNCPTMLLLPDHGTLRTVLQLEFHLFCFVTTVTVIFFLIVSGAAAARVRTQCCRCSWLFRSLSAAEVLLSLGLMFPQNSFPNWGPGNQGVWPKGECGTGPLRADHFCILGTSGVCNTSFICSRRKLRSSHGAKASLLATRSCTKGGYWHNLTYVPST